MVKGLIREIEEVLISWKKEKTSNASALKILTELLQKYVDSVKGLFGDGNYLVNTELEVRNIFLEYVVKPNVMMGGTTETGRDVVFRAFALMKVYLKEEILKNFK